MTMDSRDEETHADQEIDMVAVGASIQKYRRLAGLTQEELAESVFCSTGNLSRIETGRSKPSFPLAIRIAEKLHVGLDRLFLDAVDNKTDYYVSEIIRLLEPYSQKKKEKMLNLIKVMLEVIDEDQAKK